MSRYDFDAHRLFVDERFEARRPLRLDRDQTNYLVNVLRLVEDDTVLIFNGRDGEWRARLSGTRKAALLTPDSCVRHQTPGCDLEYLFAPLKHARLDYLVQKAVEMGVGRLRPVITRRTQTHRLNLDRMGANVIEAAQQCGILSIPQVDAPQPLETILAAWPADRALIFCDEDAPVADSIAALREDIGRSGKLAVLVGPEGGFDEAERAMVRATGAARALSLGPRILRADTAAVAALTLVQAVLGDWRRDSTTVAVTSLQRSP